MKNIYILAILMFLYVGCSSPYYGYVPVNGNYKNANCLLKSNDGLPVLAICEKQQNI